MKIEITDRRSFVLEVEQRPRLEQEPYFHLGRPAEQHEELLRVGSG